MVYEYEYAVLSGGMIRNEKKRSDPKTFPPFIQAGPSKKSVDATHWCNGGVGGGVVRVLGWEKLQVDKITPFCGMLQK